MEQTILETAAIVAARMMTGNELCVSVFHAALGHLSEWAQFDLGQKSAALFGTVTLLVPINSRVASWQWDTQPSDWGQARQTWDTRHLVRVSLLAGALICLVLACLMQRGQ